jgi:enediyne biosynthesis protein E4
VIVQTSTMTQIDEVRGGGGYNCSNDLRLHFGLGSETKIAKVEISWPVERRKNFTIFRLMRFMRLKRAMEFAPLAHASMVGDRWN